MFTKLKCILTAAVFSVTPFASALAVPLSLSEPPDFSDNFGFPAMGPVNTFMPGVNTVEGERSFGTVEGGDSDRLLVEVLPGQRVTEIKLTLTESEITGGVTVSTLSTSLLTPVFDLVEFVSVDALNGNIGDSNAITVSVGPGIYIAVFGGSTSLQGVGFASNSYFVEYTVEEVDIPEPATAALLGLGLIGLGLSRRRR